MYTDTVLFSIGFFILGLIVMSIVKKNKIDKRLNIENQMLRDHAEILDLQKKIAEIEAEKKQLLANIEFLRVNAYDNK